MPQGLIPLFNTLINDLGDGTEHNLGEFADKKLGALVDVQDSCAAIQMDLDSLEKWGSGNLVKLS